MSERVDRHHEIYDAKTNEATNHNRLIRRDSTLIVPMERSPHEALHRALAAVPALSYHLARRAYRDYKDGLDPFNSYVENMEAWQRAVENAGKHPMADPIERGIAELHVHAFEIQKPFIIEGSIPRRFQEAQVWNENEKIKIN